MSYRDRQLTISDEKPKASPTLNQAHTLKKIIKTNHRREKKKLNRTISDTSITHVSTNHSITQYFPPKTKIGNEQVTSMSRTQKRYADKEPEHRKRKLST